jgi:hypothetical protein
MTLDRRALLIACGMTIGAGVFAASTPQPVTVEKKTLTYASRGGQELLLDLYLPQSAHGRLPVIVFLHGGGWSGGTRTTGPDFKRFFAQDGFAIASIEYRLTPSITFPGNAEDVKTAIRWLRANAAAYVSTPSASDSGAHPRVDISRLLWEPRRAGLRGGGQSEPVERGSVRPRRLRSDGVQSHGRPDGTGGGDATIPGARARAGTSHVRRGGR